MKSMNTKLVLSALGIALLATPAFAQSTDRQVWHRQPAQQMQNPVGVYPNPAQRTGAAESIDSGAAFNLDRGY